MSDFILTYTSSTTGAVHSTRGGYSVFSVVRNPMFRTLTSQWSIVSTLDGVELASWTAADEILSKTDAILAAREYPSLNTPDLKELENEDFALELYAAVMSGKYEFFNDEIDTILHSPTATDEDLRWSQAARAMCRRQPAAAFAGRLWKHMDLRLTYNG